MTLIVPIYQVEWLCYLCCTVGRISPPLVVSWVPRYWSEPRHLLTEHTARRHSSLISAEAGSLEVPVRFPRHWWETKRDYNVIHHIVMLMWSSHIVWVKDGLYVRIRNKPALFRRSYWTSSDHIEYTVHENYSLSMMFKLNSYLIYLWQQRPTYPIWVFSHLLLPIEYVDSLRGRRKQRGISTKHRVTFRVQGELLGFDSNATQSRCSWCSGWQVMSRDWIPKRFQALLC